MAKYKILSKFKDKYTKEIYEVDEEIEMTVKRANEVIDNLSIYGKEFLERIDTK